jgi:hypothetical protein
MPRFQAFYVLSNLGDHSGKLGPEHPREVELPTRTARAGVEIAVVDAAGVYLDQDVAWTKDRIGNVAPGQYVRVAKL